MYATNPDALMAGLVDRAGYEIESLLEATSELAISLDQRPSSVAAVAHSPAILSPKYWSDITRHKSVIAKNKPCSKSSFR